MSCARSLCSDHYCPELNKLPCSDYPTLFSVIVNFFDTVAFTYDNTSIISVYEDVSFQGEDLSAFTVYSVKSEKKCNLGKLH